MSDKFGSKWIGELEKEDHKLHAMYKELKGRITGVCKYCAEAFGVKSQFEKAGVQLMDEYKSHPGLHKLIKNKYTILIF